MALPESIKNSHIAYSTKMGRPAVYESGMHTFPWIWEDDPIDEAFKNGDLTSREWNPQIARRIRQYVPHVLGLDSLSANYNYGGKYVHWPWLPGSPRQLNGRDSIYLVAGDLLHWHVSDGGKDDPLIEHLQEVGWNAVKDYGKSAGSEFLLTAAAGIALARLATSDNKISRRKFLRAGLAVGAGLALSATAGRFAPLMHSYSEDQNSSGIYQAVTEISKFRKTKSAWLDGRTALVISKTLDTLDILEEDNPIEAVGSIVMGWPHTYEALPLLNSQEERANAIRAFALDLEKDIFRIAKLAGYVADNEEDQNFIREVTLGLITLTDVYELKDPGTDSSDKPSQLAKESIKFSGQFRSQEVVAALRPLGNPEKFPEEIR